MNELIIFWVDIYHFWWKAPFFLFWTLFGQFLGTFPFRQALTIELNQQSLFDLNDTLNWILGKTILNRKLNELFFGKIQILNWIRLGIVNHYVNIMLFFGYSWSILQVKPCLADMSLSRWTMVRAFHSTSRKWCHSASRFDYKYIRRGIVTKVTNTMFAKYFWAHE